MTNRILSALLRRIHQLIRALNQRIHRCGRTDEGRDTNTKGHRPVLLVHGMAQALAHALYRGQRRIAASFDEANDTFVATQAGHEIRGADTALEDARDRTQQGITGLVPEAIVDRFEVITIEIRDGERMAIALTGEPDAPAL